MAYEYDLFVSYRRSYERNGTRVATASSAWVTQVFYPWLCDLWNEERPGGGVFLDQESIPKGVDWPTYLAKALRASRCLVPVWSRPYFDSRWCAAEWQSMAEREKSCNIDLAKGPGLVIPVVFHDGDSFPKDAKRRLSHDFSALSHLREGEIGDFEATSLRKRLRDDLIPNLARAVEGAPKWRKSFPLVGVAAADVELPVPLPGMGL